MRVGRDAAARQLARTVTGRLAVASRAVCRRTLCCCCGQDKRAGVNDRVRPAFNGANAVHEAPATLKDLPASVNWTEAGAVTHVKDQGTWLWTCLLELHSRYLPAD